MDAVESIQKRLNDIEYNCYKVWEEYMNKADEGIPFDVAFKWYKSQPIIQERDLLERKLRKLKEATMEPIPDYGDKFTLEAFIGMCKCGGFIDSDGCGYYATDTEMSDVAIYPSDVTRDDYRTDFTHVVWFNK